MESIYKIKQHKMGEININYSHRENSADETEYLNEGKGCAIWGFILAVVLITSACIFCYSVWVGN